MIIKKKKNLNDLHRTMKLKTIHQHRSRTFVRYFGAASSGCCARFLYKQSFCWFTLFFFSFSFWVVLWLWSLMPFTLEYYVLLNFLCFIFVFSSIFLAVCFSFLSLFRTLLIGEGYLHISKKLKFKKKKQKKSKETGLLSSSFTV